MLVATLTFSCTASVLSAETIKESRNLGQFSSISLVISADVYLMQGTTQNVEIEGDKNDLAEIETIVADGVLKIGTKNHHGGNFGDITIYITVPVINGLSVSGSGDIKAKSGLKTDELDLSVSGSGSIDIKDLTVREVSAIITGSGNIDIESGQAQSELDIEIKGSGSFSGEGFAAEEADITITGSGSAAVWAVKELDTHITGSGSVNYKGNPQVNAVSTGSGKTRSIQ